MSVAHCPSANKYKSLEMRFLLVLLVFKLCIKAKSILFMLIERNYLVAFNMGVIRALYTVSKFGYIILSRIFFCGTDKT